MVVAPEILVPFRCHCKPEVTPVAVSTTEPAQSELPLVWIPGRGLTVRVMLAGELAVHPFWVQVAV